MKLNRPWIIGLLGVGLSLPLAVGQNDQQQEKQNNRQNNVNGQNDLNKQNDVNRARQDQTRETEYQKQNKERSNLQDRHGAMASSRIQASQFIGQKVHNSDGQELGEVKDVIFDLGSGRAPVVVIGYGGALGVGATRVAVPINQLHRVEHGQLTMNATKDQFESASKTATGPWMDVGHEDWTRQVNRFYGEPNWSMRSYDRESFNPSLNRQPVREYRGDEHRADQPSTTPASPFENDGKGAPRLKDQTPLRDQAPR